MVVINAILFSNWKSVTWPIFSQNEKIWMQKKVLYIVSGKLFVCTIVKIFTRARFRKRFNFKSYSSLRFIYVL